MNIVYDKGMKIEARALHYDDDDNVVREEELAVFELPELDDIMKYDVVQKEGTSKPKVSLQFELSRSQLLNLLKATVGVEETVLEEIIPEKKEEEDETKEGEEDKDSEKSAEEQSSEDSGEKSDESTSDE